MDNIEKQNKVFTGSKKHVLDLIDSEDFVLQLNEILKPYNARIANDKTIQPSKNGNISEYGLQTFIVKNQLVKKYPLLKDFNKWWNPNGGKTPTWDMISLCEINGKEGILLVEAKAHKSEFSKSGKKLKEKCSEGSRLNHHNIKNRIDEVCGLLNIKSKDFKVSRDSYYQLSNRVAFASRLKELDIPIVLLYLGFIGDEYFKKDKFDNKQIWQETFDKYISSRVPSSFINNQESEFLFLEASLPIKDDKLNY